MKLLFPALLLLSLEAMAQTKAYPHLHVTKQPLQQGQYVTIAYSPAQAGINAESGPVTAIMLVFSRGSTIAYDTVLTLSKKNILKTRFALHDSADAVSFQFIQGKKEDNNNGNGYFFPVFGKSGEAIAGTAISMAELYYGHSGSGIKNPDIPMAEKFLRTYLSQTSKKTIRLTEYVYLNTRIKDTAAICNALENHQNFTVPKEESDYHFLSYAAGAYCNNKDLKASLEATRKTTFPFGTWRFQPWYDSLSFAEKLSEQLAWYKAFELAFGPDDEIAAAFASSTLGGFVFQSAAEQANGKVFAEMDHRMKNKKMPEKELADLYHSFAWNCAANDTLLLLAADYSNQSLQILKNLQQTLEGKLPSETKTNFRQELQKQYLLHAGTYGFLQYKLGQYDSATHYLLLAAAGEDWKNPEINERCFEAMAKTHRPQEILIKMEIAIENDGFNTSLEKKYLLTSETSGIPHSADRLNQKKAAAKEKKYREYKEAVLNRGAPSFSLTNLEGKQVSLRELKGKVVVLDFWATWCGPCIASFPGMQKVVDAYKGKDDVEVIFVNTWENAPDTGAVIKNFFDKNPFNFNVLIDAKNEVAKAFGIEGLPSKIVIDKTGTIRFKSLGASSDADFTFEDLQMMIEISKSL